MKSLQEQGITLIALVVTIIILLILAGVTIGFAMNGSGLFDKAKTATEEYNNKAEEERIALSKYENDIDEYINNSRNNSFTVTTIWEYDSTASSSDVKSGRKSGDLILSQPVTDFDEIVFLGQGLFDGGNYGQAMEVRILTDNLTSNVPSNDGTNRNFICTISVNDSRRMVYNLTANNKITVDEYSHYRLLNIKGIKY